MDLIQDQSVMPDMPSIANYISGNAEQRWDDLVSFIENTFGVKPGIAYSVCAGAPGWNVKYKKSGKALCTLYPRSESFTALVVLGASDMEKFEMVRVAYTDDVNRLYDRTRLFNNTKWLMIDVTDDDMLSDVKKLLMLKDKK